LLYGRLGLSYPQDMICAATDLRSMGYADTCHIKMFQALIDTFLILDIQVCCALIKEEHSRLSIERPSEQHTLLLPS
jgi:hypothetical protein